MSAADVVQAAGIALVALGLGFALFGVEQLAPMFVGRGETGAVPRECTLIVLGCPSTDLPGMALDAR
jgi:hypothetical protein